jgi:hypothetical protein
VTAARHMSDNAELSMGRQAFQTTGRPWRTQDVESGTPQTSIDYVAPPRVVIFSCHTGDRVDHSPRGWGNDPYGRLPTTDSARMQDGAGTLILPVRDGGRGKRSGGLPPPRPRQRKPLRHRPKDPSPTEPDRHEWRGPGDQFTPAGCSFREFTRISLTRHATSSRMRLTGQE